MCIYLGNWAERCFVLPKRLAKEREESVSIGWAHYNPGVELRLRSVFVELSEVNNHLKRRMADAKVIRVTSFAPVHRCPSALGKTDPPVLSKSDPGILT